jgi:epoxyqueuosine reductase
VSSPTAAEVKAEALRLGFMACGIVSLTPSIRVGALDRWLRAGYAGAMGYMPRQARKRKNPANITPGAHTAVILLENYTPPPEERTRDEDAFLIAAYARGTDYHLVTHGRLHRLAEWMMARGVNLAHTWVDDGPVPERELAQRAGLGWIGKNTMLINREFGSYTLIGSIFTDAVLELDQPFETDHCGSCTRCLDACPTGALVEPRVMDATRCISYLTIENRHDMPAELAARTEGWAFGCDICNDVCPWNVKFAAVTAEPEFARREDLDRSDPEFFERISETEFFQRFGDTPLMRPGLERMRRNTRVATATRKPVIR